MKDLGGIGVEGGGILGMEGRCASWISAGSGRNLTTHYNDQKEIRKTPGAEVESGGDAVMVTQ
jgi:hypothetical protein